MLNLAHRDSREEPSPLEPGRPYEVDARARGGVVDVRGGPSDPPRPGRDGLAERLDAARASDARDRPLRDAELPVLDGPSPAAGAPLADLDLPVEMLRGFALLARTAGVLGHIAEEQRQPVGMDIYLTIDRNAKYRPPRTRNQPRARQRNHPDIPRRRHIMTASTPQPQLRSVPGVPPETVEGWPGMDYSKTTDAGMRIQRNVTVPMRDGKLLRVDLYRPDHADEPLPVLIAWSPYGKHGQLDWRYWPGNDVPTEDLSPYTCFETPDPRALDPSRIRRDHGRRPRHLGIGRQRHHGRARRSQGLLRPHRVGRHRRTGATARPAWPASPGTPSSSGR